MNFQISDKQMDFDSAVTWASQLGGGWRIASFDECAHIFEQHSESASDEFVWTSDEMFDDSACATVQTKDPEHIGFLAVNFCSGYRATFGKDVALKAVAVNPE